MDGNSSVVVGDLLAKLQQSSSSDSSTQSSETGTIVGDSFLQKMDHPVTLARADSSRLPIVTVAVNPTKFAPNLASVRVRHGPSEMDRRSEASSEQTRASKFKVVKLESKAPYCRGRWQCFDFHDRPKDASKVNSDRVSSDQSSTCTTSAMLVTTMVTSTTTSSEVSPDTAVNSQVPKPSKFKVTAVHLPTSTISNMTTTNVRISSSSSSVLQESSSSSSNSTATVQSNLVSSRLQDSQELRFISDANAAALSAELTRRTTIDATSDGSTEAAGLSLDNKIRQCMDLVGNHLIIAVRGELEQVSAELAKLRAKVEELEFENSALRSENVILRSSAVASENSIRNPASRKK